MKYTAAVLGLASMAAAYSNSTISYSSAACTTTFNACSVAPDANHAYCASQYAACLGYNPFNNGTALSSLESNAAAATAGPSVVTNVVTAFTTYCPEATTLSYGGKLYTATAHETLTITDCPCTLTSTVGSSAAATKTPTPKNATATTVTPMAYTGAATKNGVVGVAGLFAIAALAI